jgi:tRNA(Ile2) C34 agmatinyltransferase TiaS
VTECIICPYCKNRMKATGRKQDEVYGIEYECSNCGGVWNYSNDTFFPVHYPTVIANGLASATKERREEMRRLGKIMI